TGGAGSFVVPQTGDLGLNVNYRITLVATDSSGLTGLSYLDLTPRVASLTLTTQPGGLPVGIDGQNFIAPTLVRGVAGMNRLLQAVPATIAGGVVYAFAWWS